MYLQDNSRAGKPSVLIEILPEDEVEILYGIIDELVNCAELSQDDLEEDTIRLLDRVYSDLPTLLDT